MCVNIQIPRTLYSEKGKIQVEKSEKRRLHCAWCVSNLSNCFAK